MAKELQYLECTYRNSRPTTSLLNSIFMTTVNTAARTLVSVASTSKPETSGRWTAADHLRFMAMMMTWLTIWVLRVLMDHFPLSLAPSSSSSDLFLERTMSFDLPRLASTVALVPASASKALVTYSGSSDLDLMLGDGVDEPSVKSLGRALSHVLALMNEIPATSRKYQFAMSMAEKIMEENARSRHVQLLNVNRIALASSFAHASARLYTSLDRSQTGDEPFAWPLRAVSVLPFGSYVASYMRGLSTCVRTVISLADATGSWLSQRRIGPARGDGSVPDREADVAVEKLAEELLWVTGKLRVYGAVEEGMVQWSYASALAGLSLTASPRVQGLMVKISALLIGDLARENIQVPGQVKFRLLVHWLPLFCHGRNGLAFPVLTGMEKAEVERSIEQALSTLPALDQEVILTNWLQDFSASASEWPNLKPAYDRWCHITRQLVM